MKYLTNDRRYNKMFFIKYIYNLTIYKKIKKISLNPPFYMYLLDGKIVSNIVCCGKVDRLPVLVSGDAEEILHGVP